METKGTKEGVKWGADPTCRPVADVARGARCNRRPHCGSTRSRLDSSASTSHLATMGHKFCIHTTDAANVAKWPTWLMLPDAPERDNRCGSTDTENLTEFVAAN